MGVLAAPLIAAGATLAGGLISNAWSAREASRNRRFQEQMSSTAHQREVADLRRAGINPMWRGLGGSSSPSGAVAEVRDPVGPAVSSALAVRAQRAQIALLEAQADRETSGARLNEAQIADLVTTGKSGRYEMIRNQADIAAMDLEQKRDLFPALLARAREEVALITNSARAAKASAILDELARNKAANISDLERRMGELSPAVRLLFELLRSAPSIRGGTTINPTNIIRR